MAREAAEQPRRRRRALARVAKALDQRFLARPELRAQVADARQRGQADVGGDG
jgi:hypothetical protein